MSTICWYAIAVFGWVLLKTIRHVIESIHSDNEYLETHLSTHLNQSHT